MEVQRKLNLKKKKKYKRRQENEDFFRGTRVTFLQTYKRFNILRGSFNLITTNRLNINK